jgi:hypothetical protein
MLPRPTPALAYQSTVTSEVDKFANIVRGAGIRPQ